MTATDAFDSATGRLFARAAAGDAAAFEALVAPWLAPLEVLVLREGGGALGAEFAAEDAVQDALARAWRLLPEARFAGRRAFYAWLVALARAVLADRRKFRAAERRRGTRALPGEELPAAVTSVARRAMRREEAAMLARALDALPEPQREVVVRHLVEAATLSEIAAALGVTKNAVWERLRRGLAALRARLDADAGRGGDGVR